MNTYSHEAMPRDDGAVITLHRAFEKSESGLFVPTAANTQGTLTIAQLVITPPAVSTTDQLLPSGLILPGSNTLPFVESRLHSSTIELCPDLTSFKETLPPFILKVLQAMGHGAMISCTINDDSHFPDQPARTAFLEAIGEMSGIDLSRLAIDSQIGPPLHTGQYL